MINYLSSNLSLSIYQFSYQELNSINSKSYVWNGSLIVFGAFYNYTNLNFNNLELTDNAGNNILHTAGTHSNCYTVAFSGTNAGNPLNTNLISDMNTIFFNWTLAAGTATTGSLMVKLYYI
jgi:hypothetical protein